MRKIIVFENVTVDGYFAGENGEIDWAIRDEEITEFSREGGNTPVEFWFGRVTYEMMASFWPTQAGKTANPVFAKVLNESSKRVFSKTLKEVAWQGTKLIKEIDMTEIEKNKKEGEGNIMIFGSGQIVAELSQLGLVDEYQLMVNPVILGKGKSLFEGLDQRINFRLTRTKEFKCGVVFLQYERNDKTK